MSANTSTQTGGRPSPKGKKGKKWAKVNLHAETKTAATNAKDTPGSLQGSQQSQRTNGPWNKGKGSTRQSPPVETKTAVDKWWSTLTRDVQVQVLRDLETLHAQMNHCFGRVRQAESDMAMPTTRRAVVAIDCEMVQTGTTREVVEVCAVDVLTGEVLVETGVIPNAPVTNWCTKWSGMTPGRLRSLERMGKAVHGWQEARKVVHRFVDEHTIIVGHAVQNDLEVLHMVHTRILDTALVTQAAVTREISPASCTRTWKLKALCEDLLGLGIQRSGKGHDCLEDTRATREVLLSCVRCPEKLQKWAVQQSDVVLCGPSAWSSSDGGDLETYNSVEDFM
ncbi:ribonuclease H-like domain-containing protein [Aspergillus avenaceus]|uniref:Ribonuclease H-like domain-containing protein n=1 Tax=Aspergillus avenaceus TaxID=36643 RepID=A0A5N6U532_ASPAV|nr:ribonuclease H-like domain-containing protein [Aspergillus avenaceus]